MKNKNFIYIFILLMLIISAILFLVNKNKSNNNNNTSNNYYQAEKTLANQTQNSSLPNNITFISNSSPEDNVINTETNTVSLAPAPIETEISSFSTKIHNKDTERQNNITITCSTLNNTIVAPNTEFSFGDIVGKSTSAKGYQEADVFTADGEVTKGLGGGNCQVSTTLYNAVLKIPELQVTERHEHSGKVPYIEEGKDAAVAYGNYDLKFINHTNYSIKIVAENTVSEVSIKLLKIT